MKNKIIRCAQRAAAKWDDKALEHRRLSKQDEGNLILYTEIESLQLYGQLGLAQPAKSAMLPCHLRVKKSEAGFLNRNSNYLQGRLKNHHHGPAALQYRTSSVLEFQF